MRPPPFSFGYPNIKIRWCFLFGKNGFGIKNMLYESPRRKPGWRFTAGFESGLILSFRLTDIWDNFAGHRFDCEESGQSFGVPVVFLPSLCYFKADSILQTSNLLVLAVVLNRTRFNIKCDKNIIKMLKNDQFQIHSASFQEGSWSFRTSKNMNKTIKNWRIQKITW